MAKKKKKDKKIVGVAVSVAPVVEERDKKKSGGAMTEKNTWEKTNIEKKKRYGMKKGGKGIEALRKEAPEVVERMGYQKGKEVKVDGKILIADSDNSQIFKSMEDWKKGTNPNWNTLSQDSKGNIYVDYSVKETPPSIIDKFLNTAEDVRKFLKRHPGKEEAATVFGIRKIQKELMDYKANREEYEKNFPQMEKERLARGDFYEGEEGYKSPFAEGGDVDAQMAMLMPTEKEPMMEEQEQDMMPDEQMEDEYLDFIIDQSLSPEEETTLMTKLEADPELSVMFDKVMDTAMEFAGSGPVDGPGSGVSDSIPARLSDGEFVFTAKATEQIGADRLQSMMEDAEAQADAMRQEMQVGGEVEEKPKVDEFGKPIDKDIAEDEIKKGMLSVNPRMQ